MTALDKMRQDQRDGTDLLPLPRIPKRYAPNSRYGRTRAALPVAHYFEPLPLKSSQARKPRMSLTAAFPVRALPDRTIPMATFRSPRPKPRVPSAASAPERPNGLLPRQLGDGARRDAALQSATSASLTNTPTPASTDLCSTGRTLAPRRRRSPTAALPRLCCHPNSAVRIRGRRQPRRSHSSVDSVLMLARH
jgi:hypothetical protein